jgi:hypothetical protein
VGWARLWVRGGEGVGQRAIATIGQREVKAGACTTRGRWRVGLPRPVGWLAGSGDGPGPIGPSPRVMNSMYTSTGDHHRK